MFNETESPAAPRRRRSGPLRVFVVENHEDTRVAFCTLLEQLGYQVVCADSVSGALQGIPQLDLDVLICDIDLPDGSGWDVMRRLATRPRFAIALTGRDGPGDAARSQSAGFKLHLRKPLAIEQLLQSLEAAEVELTEEAPTTGVAPRCTSG